MLPARFLTFMAMPASCASCALPMDGVYTLLLFLLVDTAEEGTEKGVMRARRHNPVVRTPPTMEYDDDEDRQQRSIC